MFECGEEEKRRAGESGSIYVVLAPGVWGYVV